MASDDLAAEIALHTVGDAVGERLYCPTCFRDWPCLVRRLAEGLEAVHEEIEQQLTRGPVDLVGIADRVDAALGGCPVRLDDPLAQPAPEREG